MGVATGLKENRLGLAAAGVTKAKLLLLASVGQPPLDSCVIVSWLLCPTDPGGG